MEESRQRQELYLRHHLGIFFVLITSLVGLMVSRRPEDGPLFVILVLALIFFTAMTVSSLALRVFSSYFKAAALSGVRILYTSLVIAVGLIYLIGLRTIGQLQVIDVALVVVFELLLNFYLLRRF